MFLRDAKSAGNVTLELNNSAPDHLIELNFSTLNHFRMYIMMLMLEQLSAAANSTLVQFCSYSGVNVRVLWDNFGGTCRVILKVV